MKSILLVDDEPSIVSYISAVAKVLDYRVEAAKDGAEALWLYEMDPQIDALVTDVRMPVIGGFELANRLRAKRANLPILIISGYFESDGSFPVSTFISSGYHYLAKPFTKEQLIRSLELLFL